MNENEQQIFDALPAEGSVNYAEWYEGLDQKTRGLLTANIQPMKRRGVIVTAITDGVHTIQRGEV